MILPFFVINIDKNWILHKIPDIMSNVILTTSYDLHTILYAACTSITFATCNSSNSMTMKGRNNIPNVKHFTLLQILGKAKDKQN